MSDMKTVDVVIERIFVSGGHDFFGRYGKGSLDHGVEEKDEVELVARKGVVGDRFFDYKEDYKGQITFFDGAVYDAVREEICDGGELEPSAFRRNVLVRGVDLNELIGKEFELGGVRFTGSCECSPCFWMDEAVGEGCHEFLKGRGGLRCRILDNGVLRVGEGKLVVRRDA